MRRHLFTIFGFKIFADATWLLIVTFIAYSLATSLFPTLIEDVPRSTLWVMGVAGALGLFASVLLHELAHAAVARRYGMETKGITLFLFGGVAELQGEPPHPKAEAAVAAVGPLVSVLIGVALLAVDGFLPDVAGTVAGYVGVLNLILAVFNTIPAFPLDGGRVLRALLWHRRGDLRSATRTAAKIGAGFGAVLIGLGAFRLFSGDVVGGVWYALIGLFLRGAARSSYASVAAHADLDDVPLASFVRRDVVRVPAFIPLKTLVEEFFYRDRHETYPVVDGDRLVGLVATADLARAPADRWDEIVVGDVARPVQLGVNAVAADAPASAALDALGHGKAHGVAVVDAADRLVGMVFARDLLAHLDRRREIERAARPHRRFLRPRTT